ncbi:hypothetical protein Slin15195_G065810 [Septoria linicola]|uniref:Copper acquisition factor BIM1-like domain-containing protein n=1 Tax=Septoria linicola TaxID=215465 RepID=A0A9Q9AWJ9_9PEZI|nr:hypothetical protein Slin14017_G116150 [Septoria linicola]USW53262.1 hypothetical protein Slin15195_G065810 [Septoria linicola]
MHFTWSVILAAIASGMTVAQHAPSSEMGPAAFMWPEDRPWSADADNTAPCGSSSGVGLRTEFPMSNGRLALVTQDDTRAVHVGISYSDNPTSMSDFEVFTGPQQLDLDLGHTCIWTPDPPANVEAGSNATFQVFYVGEESEDMYYACTDVTFVDVATFDERIPCFNATRSEPETSTDEAVSVTTTRPDGSDPHPEFSSKDNGLSGGAIAGVVIGSLAGVALIAGAIFFLWRRNKKSKAAATQPSMQQVEKALSETSSQ